MVPVYPKDGIKGFNSTSITIYFVKAQIILHILHYATAHSEKR